MAINYTALATEINTDPQTLGLVALKNTGQDAAIAVALNALTGNGAANIFKATVVASDVQTALDPTEFATLTALQLNQLSVILSGAVVNSGVASVRQIIVAIFSPAGSFPNTRAALSALAQRTGSRAEVLFGFGTVIAHTDVAKALGRV